jgi:light-regulated signal transduction histidine kinase (bacteriophytochrome)
MLSSIQSCDNELYELNEDLRRSNGNLTRSNEDLERFAFIASHDLQEPLRMITIYLQLLAREYPSRFDEKASRYMDNVQNGARRMRSLLADLLAYAEIGAPFDLPPQPVDLNLVVQKAEQNLSLVIAESDAEITVGNLPVVVGFESHFLPLFQNLIGNAIKYRGPQAPLVNIEAKQNGAQIEIAVADNGIGIAPEYHGKIFVAFKRLHSNKIPGTGIGLAICQRVVEKYGGRIWVESGIGRGAIFFVNLPVSLVATASLRQDN